MRALTRAHATAACCAFRPSARAAPSADRARAGRRPGRSGCRRRRLPPPAPATHSGSGAPRPADGNPGLFGRRARARHPSGPPPGARSATARRPRCRPPELRRETVDLLRCEHLAPAAMPDAGATPAGQVAAPARSARQGVGCLPSRAPTWARHVTIHARSSDVARAWPAVPGPRSPEPSGVARPRCSRSTQIGTCPRPRGSCRTARCTAASRTSSLGCLLRLPVSFVHLPSPLSGLRVAEHRPGERARRARMGALSDNRRASR